MTTYNKQNAINEAKGLLNEVKDMDNLLFTDLHLYDIANDDHIFTAIDNLKNILTEHILNLMKHEK